MVADREVTHRITILHLNTEPVSSYVKTRVVAEPRQRLCAPAGALLYEERRDDARRFGRSLPLFVVFILILHNRTASLLGLELLPQRLNLHRAHKPSMPH